VNADVEYLETWSLAGDCWIVLRTVIEMFSPPKQAV
jgi:lipopolysaccharide/colanic/teichoic acid biosynthesis glycosyltransferase